ncbi:hypothetical protein RI367_000865 [Sorochytrium milnesiophthora]
MSMPASASSSSSPPTVHATQPLSASPPISPPQPHFDLHCAPRILYTHDIPAGVITCHACQKTVLLSKKSRGGLCPILAIRVHENTLRHSVCTVGFFLHHSAQDRASNAAAAAAAAAAIAAASATPSTPAHMLNAMQVDQDMATATDAPTTKTALKRSISGIFKRSKPAAAADQHGAGAGRPYVPPPTLNRYGGNLSLTSYECILMNPIYALHNTPPAVAVAAAADAGMFGARHHSHANATGGMSVFCKVCNMYLNIASAPCKQEQAAPQKPSEGFLHSLSMLIGSNSDSKSNSNAQDPAIALPPCNTISNSPMLTTAQRDALLVQAVSNHEVGSQDHELNVLKWCLRVVRHWGRRVRTIGPDDGKWAQFYGHFDGNFSIRNMAVVHVERSWRVEQPPGKTCAKTPVTATDMMLVLTEEEKKWHHERMYSAFSFSRATATPSRLPSSSSTSSSSSSSSSILMNKSPIVPSLPSIPPSPASASSTPSLAPPSISLYDHRTPAATSSSHLPTYAVNFPRSLPPLPPYPPPQFALVAPPSPASDFSWHNNSGSLPRPPSTSSSSLSLSNYHATDMDLDIAGDRSRTASFTNSIQELLNPADD